MSDCRKTGDYQRIITAALLIIFLCLAGCAAKSQAGAQAARGGVLGAVGGAVAGAVSGLLWGGNPIEGAVKGSITGAVSGAAVGAVSGVMADSQGDRQAENKTVIQANSQAVQKDGRLSDLAQLQKKIGPKNFEASMLLADCKHKQAIETAQEAFREANDNDRRSYALLLRAIAAEEMGDKDQAALVYPEMVKQDPTLENKDKARSAALEGIIRLQKLRQDHSMAPTCANLRQ